MIVLSTRDSTLFRLNETATAIWEAADGVTPLREIAVREICSRFNVAENTAYLDAESVVRQLGDRGLLILSNTPVTPERR
jgi:hypothetical protein